MYGESVVLEPREMAYLYYLYYINVETHLVFLLQLGNRIFITSRKDITFTTMSISLAQPRRPHHTATVEIHTMGRELLIEPDKSNFYSLTDLNRALFLLVSLFWHVLIRLQHITVPALLIPI